MRNVVVIPVYKTTLTKSEQSSLMQALHVLGTHEICLVGPKELDLSVYLLAFEQVGKELLYEAFNPGYFRNVSGYNTLLLSRCFYERFSSFDYMLIYQLDAWVFRDELDSWCNKGYDYIGAPWLKLNRELDEENSGNGGFSLRKIATFIDLFDYQGALWGYKGLACRYRYRGPLHKYPLIVKGLLGKKNRLQDFIEKGDENEDLFYAALKHKKEKPFRIPSTKEAMFFSFEEAPSLLYERTNHQLPFGCHAWEKYEYDSFWKQYINIV